MALSGPIERADVRRLCRRVHDLLADGKTRLVVCDVAEISSPDVMTVDVLARLQLTARRAGCAIRVQGACRSLRELLALSGLSEVVPLLDGSDVELGRQPEEREEVSGVEEERDPGDLPV
jgi:ABC-type transporter Mla MlaB component